MSTDLDDPLRLNSVADFPLQPFETRRGTRRASRAMALAFLLAVPGFADACQATKGFLGGSTARQPTGLSSVCSTTDRQLLGRIKANVKRSYPLVDAVTSPEAYRVKDYHLALNAAVDAFDRINYTVQARGTLSDGAGRWVIVTSTVRPNRSFLLYGMLGEPSDHLYLFFLSGELFDQATPNQVIEPPSPRW